MMNMPARPSQTLRPVTSMRWSWYHWNAARSGPPFSVSEYVYVRLPPGGISRFSPGVSSGWPSSTAATCAPWLWIVSEPADSGSWFWNVTCVAAPAGRRIVGPGNVPPKVHICVGGPARIGTAACWIGIVMSAPVRTGGIGSGVVDVAPAGAANASRSEPSVPARRRTGRCTGAGYGHAPTRVILREEDLVSSLSFRSTA